MILVERRVLEASTRIAAAIFTSDRARTEAVLAVRLSSDLQVMREKVL